MTGTDPVDLPYRPRFVCPIDDPFLSTYAVGDFAMSPSSGVVSCYNCGSASSHDLVCAIREGRKVVAESASMLSFVAPNTLAGEFMYRDDSVVPRTGYVHYKNLPVDQQVDAALRVGPGYTRRWYKFETRSDVVGMVFRMAHLRQQSHVDEVDAAWRAGWISGVDAGVTYLDYPVRPSSAPTPF